jgi:hypothetical protein
VTITPATFSPSPVSVTTPTIIPAVAVVATTGSTARAPDASARARRDGPNAVSRRRKLAATASTVAQNTARNAVTPLIIRTTIATSDPR